MKIVKLPNKNKQEYRIHFTFPDNMISYDCTYCKGSCCHVNNSLLLDSETSDSLSKTYLKDFIDFRYGVPLLSCGKKCWFLTENGCNLKTLGFNKPLTCELYPFFIKKILNYYIVSYQPCPNFHINLESGQKYVVIEDIVSRYLKTGVPIHKIDINVSSERIQYELEYQQNFKLKLYDLYYSKINKNLQKSTCEKWFLYYLDMRWNRIPLSYTSKQSEHFWVLYEKVCKEVYQKMDYLNDDNLYFIIANQFNKVIFDTFKLKGI